MWPSFHTSNNCSLIITGQLTHPLAQPVNFSLWTQTTRLWTDNFSYIVPNFRNRWNSINVSEEYRYDGHHKRYGSDKCRQKSAKFWSPPNHITIERTHPWVSEVKSCKIRTIPHITNRCERRNLICKGTYSYSDVALAQKIVKKLGKSIEINDTKFK